MNECPKCRATCSHSVDNDSTIFVFGCGTMISVYDGVEELRSLKCMESQINQLEAENARLTKIIQCKEKAN